MSICRRLGAWFAMSWWGAAAAHAQTVDIPAQGLVGISSLTEAVNLAEPGAVLELSAGDFYEPGPVPIDAKTLTIRGAGQGVTTITTATGFSVLEVGEGSLTLEDVSIVVPSQRGVFAVGSSGVIIRSTTFETGDSSLYLGGAVYMNGAGPLVVENVTFIGDPGEAAAGHGGAIHVTGTEGDVALLTDVVFEGVEASRNGGAISSADVDLVCTRCTFAGTSAALEGGAIFLASGTLWVEQSTFCGTSAEISGAAITGSGDVTVVSSVFGEGLGASDSLVYAVSGAWSLTNNSFVGNASTAVAVAAGSDASVVVSANLFLDNDGYGIDDPSPFGGYNWFEGNSAGAASDPPLSANNYVDLEHEGELLIGGPAATCAYPPSMYLAVGSPLVDAGNPALVDPDGTPSDVGAFGGPYADPAAHFDADGDGFSYLQDCDDTNPAVSLDGTEICDGIDNDCDDRVDDADPGIVGQIEFFPDCDHDGQGATDERVESCTTPVDPVCGTGVDVTWLTVATAGPWAGADCNDADPTLFTSLWRADEDQDGFADQLGEGIESCGPPDPSWLVAEGTDCDDEAADVHPEAVELCNERDDDCDGAVDEDLSPCPAEEVVESAPPCGCASSPGAAPALVLLGGLIGARRRRSEDRGSLGSGGASVSRSWWHWARTRR